MYFCVLQCFSTENSINLHPSRKILEHFKGQQLLASHSTIRVIAQNEGCSTVTESHRKIRLFLMSACVKYTGYLQRNPIIYCTVEQYIITCVLVILLHQRKAPQCLFTQQKVIGSPTEALLCVLTCECRTLKCLQSGLHSNYHGTVKSTHTLSSVK